MNETVNTNHDEAFKGMDTLQIYTTAIFPKQHRRTIFAVLG